MELYPWLAHFTEQLLDRKQRQCLHHGMLLLGANDLGKLAAAEYVAKGLLCQNSSPLPCNQCQSCQLFEAGTHADYQVIESERQIGIDAIRDGIKKCQETAFLSGNKVLLIKQAETMTESSANALLKTLEEPTNGTFIFLLVEQPHRLLPTILSRVEKLTLPIPSYDMLVDWLHQGGCHANEPDLIELYRSAPLKLKALLEDPEHDQFTYSVLKMQLKKLIKGEISPSDMSVHWCENPTDAIDWLQRYLIEANKKYMIRHETYWQIYSLTVEAKQSILHVGVNKSLILSHLFQQLLIAVKK